MKKLPSVNYFETFFTPPNNLKCSSSNLNNNMFSSTKVHYLTAYPRGRICQLQWPVVSAFIWTGFFFHILY